MSLIKDVKEELESLDQSIKKIRQFSALMLVVFGLLWYYALQVRMDWLALLSVLFFFFFLSGFRCGSSVRFVHKYWMGLALVIGWFVSRILLGLIYFIIVTPIGLISRIFGKSFLALRFDPQKKSYWKKRAGAKIDYTKMS
jgi:saxitoxin biosynthesis operon SxtJ-like protein